MFTLRHLVTVSVLLSPAAASTALAGTIYEQNFDQVGQAALAIAGAGHSVAIGSLLPEWSVMANNASQATVTVGDGSVGGYTAGAYLATGDGTHFDLSIYNTKSVGNFITLFTYTAGAQISGINGSFDYESAWSLYQGANSRGGNYGVTTGGFELGLTYLVTHLGSTSAPTFLTATPSGDSSTTGWHVQNNLVTSTDRTVWLTDARMDALGLSDRGLCFDLPDVTLNPGDTLTLKWEQSAGARDKNQAQGIDNFVLNGMFETSGNNVPDGGTTLALLCLGLTGLFGLRRLHTR
jgi:hypothetical protein